MYPANKGLLDPIIITYVTYNENMLHVIKM